MVVRRLRALGERRCEAAQWESIDGAVGRCLDRSGDQDQALERLLLALMSHRIVPVSAPEGDGTRSRSAVPIPPPVRERVVLLITSLTARDTDPVGDHG
ncbi:CATRA system-associated protein [Herbidospora cretacea]|uniref:CATRA system-associated protein n=1 Tax=Herbidospora cretacea TaxID=28444 RepID=UPI000AE27C3F|nr:CATRA system-associated protein [Herbidospora cretacea]